jgi:YD repeat-containing protein
VLGRLTADAVTNLGGGVDGAVRRLETAYDGQGNAFLFTSYDAMSNGTIINQVARAFNRLGQLLAEYQAHGGPVNIPTTPTVQYTYSEMAGGANHSRPTGLVYPDGFTVGYNYASGLDSAISRLTSLTNGPTTLEAYTYLGLGTVVERTHPQSGVDLTYVGTGPGDGGDQYVGLDRFGRVVDQRWKNGSGTDLDRYQYGYDRDGNRTYRENLVGTGRSEVYAYDGLNQLTGFQRGTLNAAKDGITGTVARGQTWDPDGAGNFDTVTTDGTLEARTHNRQNQVTAIGAGTPAYDAAGNLTADGLGRAFAYDAWHRLMSAQAAHVVNYDYDALGRRIREDYVGQRRDLYLTAAAQVIEERVDDGMAPAARQLWGLGYVDALVLRDRDTDADGTLDERLYALQDANYNVSTCLAGQIKCSL